MKASLQTAEQPTREKRHQIQHINESVATTQFYQDNRTAVGNHQQLQALADRSRTTSLTPQTAKQATPGVLPKSPVIQGAFTKAGLTDNFDDAVTLFEPVVAGMEDELYAITETAGGPLFDIIIRQVDQDGNDKGDTEIVYANNGEVLYGAGGDATGGMTPVDILTRRLALRITLYRNATVNQSVGEILHTLNHEYAVHAKRMFPWVRRIAGGNQGHIENFQIETTNPFGDLSAVQHHLEYATENSPAFTNLSQAMSSFLTFAAEQAGPLGQDFEQAQRDMWDSENAEKEAMRPNLAFQLMLSALGPDHVRQIAAQWLALLSNN